MTFDNHERPSRLLTYPLREDLVLDAADNADGAITKVTADFFPTDPDEKIDVTFNLSFNEFTAIASSIDIGRDIGYGEQSALIWWTWIRSLKGIGGAAVTCEDVADCIETSDEVQNAITTNYNIMLQILMATANSGTGDTPAIDSETSTIYNTPFAAGTVGTVSEPIKELDNCNLDALWAGIRDGIVARLDDNARSMLEFLVTKADLAERATALIGAIPIFGSMAQAVLDQMVAAAPDMLNLFDSYSSIENMDTIACEIFGQVCAECRYPTMEEVYTYYALYGITGMNDLENIVISTATDLLFGSTELVALAFYHTMISYQLFILLLGAKFHGATGTAAIVRMANLGEDSANDNWILLCDSCNESYQLWTWDFSTQGQGEFYKDTVTPASNAIFLAGQGWRAGNYGAGKRGDVCMAFNPAWKIRGVGMVIEGSTPSSTIFYRRPTWGSNTGVVAPSAGTTCGEYTKAWDGYLGLDGYNELLFFWQGGATDIMTLKKVSIVFDTGFSPQPAIPTTDSTIC